MGKRSALLVALARVIVSALLIVAGFTAVSDDDFARVVIAERFAHAPSLDPSGTSWLPLPFWIVGSAMSVLGRSVESARAVAFVLGVLSAQVVYLAARWLEIPPQRALLGALVACAIPYSAWLGVATVPDGPTAALIVLGAAAVSSSRAALRALGGAALGAACLSRYEAWPVAAAFALFSAWDALRARDAKLAFAALLSVAPAVWWMAHGARVHGQPLFFVERVAAYRAALGGPEASVAARLIRFPLSVLRCEPELAGIALVALLGAPRGALARYRRVLVLMGTLLVFLVAGDLRGGAPTHHGERAVLAIWLVFAIMIGELLPAARARRASALAAVAVALLGTFAIRPWFTRRDAFIDRSREIAVGEVARSKLAPGDRLLVDSPDFGYFAVIAGFGRPEDASPVDDHDPRRPRVDVTPDVLRERAASEHARWLVTRRGGAYELVEVSSR